MGISGTVRRRHPLVWLLFGFSGRISRGVYWLTYVGLVCLAAAVLGQSMSGGTARFSAAAVALEPVFSVVALYCNIAIAWKRLHDFGKDGRYALVLLLPLPVVLIVIVTGLGALLPLASLINFIATIWFGVPRSEPGPNRFGSAPNLQPGR